MKGAIRRFLYVLGGVLLSLLVAVFLLSRMGDPGMINTCASGGSPSVRTDKPDYGAGEIVHIAGSGFPCEALLTVVISAPDNSITARTIATDKSGNFTHIYQIGTENVQGQFQVRALDADGNLLASTVFYDTHFRFGHITWKRDSSDPANVIRITFIAGFRRNGYVCRNPITGATAPCTGPDGPPGMGDVFLETIGATRINDFGDNISTGTLYFKVFAWDTRGVTLGPPGYHTLYSTQVVIEDLDASNNPISKSVLDPFIRIVELPGQVEGLIRIPVRWCGLAGSPSGEDPGILNRTSTDEILLERLRVMNANIYTPQANVEFISGARTGSFPVIQGPRPDGHIPNSTRIQDFHRSVNRCRLAWRDLDPAVTGIIALNINRFADIDSSGNATSTTYPLGWAGPTRPGDLGQQLLNGVASVIDAAYFVPTPDPRLPTPPPFACQSCEFYVFLDAHSRSVGQLRRALYRK